MQYRYTYLALLAATAAAAPLPQNTNFPFDLSPISVPPPPATPLDPVLQIVSDGPDLILGAVTQSLTDPAANGSPNTGVTGIDNSPIGGVVEAVETQAAAGQVKRQNDPSETLSNAGNYVAAGISQGLTNPADDPSTSTGIGGIDNTPIGGIIGAAETQAAAGQVKRQNDPSELLSNAGNYVAAGLSQGLTNPADDPSSNTGIGGIDNTPIGGIIGAAETQAAAGQVKRQSDPSELLSNAGNYVAAGISQGLTNPADDPSTSTGIGGIDNTPIGGIIGAAETQAQQGQVKRQTGVEGIDNSPIGGLLEATGLDQVVQGTNQVVNLPAIINE